jgi:nuclear-control-of-ATPase protein 2
MGAAFSHPLTITLLLSLIPLSTSWGLFKKPPPPGSANDAQTLASAAIDSFQNGATKNVASSSTLGSTESILPAYQQFPDLLPIWELFSLPKVITDTIPAYLKAVLLFKPPVGITSVYVFFNLILSRNKKLVRSLLLDEGDQQPISNRNRRRTKIGRSLDLDEADGKLRMGLGGVEAVRAELCIAALDDLAAQTVAPIMNNRQDPFQGDPKMDLSNPKTRDEFANAAKDALKINASPRSAKEDYIESTLIPLSRLEGLFALYRSFDAQFYHRLGSSKQRGDYGSDVLWMSAKVAEVRTLDALLRVLRERLLTSAVRLSKKEKYRAWRLQWYENGFGRLGKRWIRRMLKGRTLEDDRVNLQLTSAALKREMERLGQVQMLLLNRPTELSETLLLMAASATQADEKGPNRSGKIDAAGAKVALQAKYKCKSDASLAYGYDSVQMYNVDAHEWTVNARALIYELVTETLTVAFKPDEKVENDRNTTVAYDLQTLGKWATYEKCDFEGWDTALTLTENLSKARLMREQKYLPTAIDLKQLWKRIDVLGIPSSLAVVAGALVVHNLVYIPYWDDIVESGKFLLQAVWGVIEFRFWTPLKDIVLDLLNRRPRLLDPYALANEEISLDNMLKDLGIGDGTKECRPEALAEASRMYEKELAQGAIKNLFRGAMVRLLLIQVQQLKTGLLQAMGSIDDLMDSNRLNVQLLATIPAILLVTFGTRVFFRALYSLRSRDLIGLPNAKAEMGDLLRKMERCLLLASHAEDIFESSGTLKDKTKNDMLDAMQKPVVLQPKELGEFLLHMHSYLVILDFCSPPFPTKGCDSIHSALQDLLMQGQLSTKRQIALLQVSLQQRLFHSLHAKSILLSLFLLPFLP